MTLLLLYMKYARCTWHVTVSAYINDVVVRTWKYPIRSLCKSRLVHDYYRIYGLYTKCTICMLRLVHDGVICAIVCYGIATIISPIVTVNMEYHIIVLYCLQLGFSDINRFCCIWFFSFLLLIAVGFFVWVRFKVSLE